MPPAKPRTPAPRRITEGDPLETLASLSAFEPIGATPRPSAFDEARDIDAARDDIGPQPDPRFEGANLHFTSDAESAEYDPNAPPTPEEIERIRAQRGPRLGLFTQKLALPARPGYYRHWFNGEAGRVETALKNGWTHVREGGKPVRRPVGMGRDNGVLYAYAMEIPEVFWREDMAARHKEASERMRQLKTQPIKAMSGASDKSDAQKFYSPHESGEIIETR